MTDRRTLKRLLDLARPHWKPLGQAMLCMVGVSAFTAASAWLIKPALDDIFFRKDMTMLKILPVAVLLVFFLKGLCTWGSDYLLRSVGITVVTRLRQSIYNHLQDLPLSYFDHSSTGTLMSRIMNDVTEMQDAITKALTGPVRDGFTVVGLLGVVFWQNWQLACLAVVFLPIGFYPVFVFGSRLRRLARRRQEVLGDLSSMLQETLAGARVVKAFGTEEHEKARFRARNDRVNDYTIRSIWIEGLSAPIMELMGAFGIAAIIGYGGYQVIQDVSTPGTFFSFLGAIIMLYKPVKNLSKMNSIVQRGLASTQRVYAVLDEPVTVMDRPGAVELPPVHQGIELRGVSFSYGDATVLREIALSVRAGEVVALVGSSGGGKTTLVNLIPRFYDVTEGAVLVDGHDVRDVTLQSLRRQIAIVTQQSFLFNDTVGANIAYGETGRTEEDIAAAARAAFAHDFIMELPEGYGTVIGEQGVRLSGGQRQRICIARAILRNAPVLILDEATSSLDSQAEQEVQRALENLMVGRTTFVIAHRLSTIQFADRILVLSDGRIVEEGTHAVLMERSGEYRRLHDIQFCA